MTAVEPAARLATALDENGGAAQSPDLDRAEKTPPPVRRPDPAGCRLHGPWCDTPEANRCVRGGAEAQ
ncbi:hypothetical protein AB0L75_14060 [Streptomyces sp. NPDC052101]|uniref:hypothetical protein n=1 Tax=Streptomyces sp. NPDC052101 TaxID=3155763 RepID=UPI00342F2C6F